MSDATSTAALPRRQSACSPIGFLCPSPPRPPFNMHTPCKHRHSSSLPPKNFNAMTRCYRCLALDHKVRDCRDPVRCRRCWRVGHTQHGCLAILPPPLPLQTPNTPTPPTPTSSATHPPLLPPRLAPASMADYIPLDLNSSQEEFPLSPTHPPSPRVFSFPEQTEAAEIDLFLYN